MMTEQRINDAALTKMRKDAEWMLSLRSPATDEEWWQALLSIIIELQERRTTSTSGDRLTTADMEALKQVPSGWFKAEHLPFNRPIYRCERLEKGGKLQRRVIGIYPDVWSEFKLIEGVQS
ncbi:hypothetical protein QMG90_07870 [Trabulsiella odontotermitis]|uniref:hypothetical protein n=1 Tax=Trabulsiella odontotermitis TaxID=379893 RepID=UPI0024B72894|nr:hypothetical protein [Trabulsiella odontotermitis]WHP32808.1 hypothetical protein QMG90_07870 [Trabulsiella odontotermitis]